MIYFLHAKIKKKQILYLVNFKSFLKFFINLKRFQMEKYINEIPPDMFSNLHQIGSGSFSDIFSAIHVKTNVKIALKISIKEHVQENLDVLKQEVEINKILFHPFICKFFQEIETEHLHIIVMELIEGISALDYVNETSGIQISEAKDIFTQLLIAIEYLHNEAHITHRDLKLENIMIDYYGHIRLIDFGFSSMKTMMSTCCGTIPYCAPEVLSCESYTKASDIWSLGIVLYALIDGNLPFYHPNINTLVTLIVESSVSFPETITGPVRDLLSKMLIKDPNTRITIDEIKVHPFICQEKLLQINYKQLFSPSFKGGPSMLKFYNSTDKVQPIKCFKHSSGSGIPAPIKKSSHLRPINTNLLKTKNFDFNLQERILLKTDNIDQLIDSRRDFAENLNRLIDSAYTKNKQYSNMKLVNSCDMIPEIHIAPPNYIPLPKKDFELSSDQIQFTSTAYRKRRLSGDQSSHIAKRFLAPISDIKPNPDYFSDGCEDNNNEILTEEQILM